MRFMFFSFLLFFCFCVLGSSLCRNSIVKLHKQVETATTGGRDLFVLDYVSKDLSQKYYKNPDQFVDIFRENINSEDVLERGAVLNVIKYMKKPPIAIQRLIVGRLEDPHLGIREAAYRTLMTFDIIDTVILQKLEEKRREGNDMERMFAGRVLDLQESKAKLRRRKAQRSQKNN